MIRVACPVKRKGCIFAALWRWPESCAGRVPRYTYHLSIEHPWWQILSPPPSKSSTLGSSIRERVCPFLLRRRFPSAAYMLNYRPVAGTVPSRVHSDSCTQICQQPFRTTLRCAFLDGGETTFPVSHRRALHEQFGADPAAALPRRQSSSLGNCGGAPTRCGAAARMRLQLATRSKTPPTCIAGCATEARWWK